MPAGTPPEEHNPGL